MSAWREPSRLLVALALVPLALDLAAGLRPAPLPPPLRAAAGTFTCRAVSLTAAEKALLGRIPVTKRCFGVSDDRVMVLHADASLDRHAVHDVTYCLQAGGWRIVRDADRAEPGGTVRVVRAERAPGEALSVVWFFQCDDRRYTSRWRYQADYLRARWWPGSAPALTRVIAVAADAGAADPDRLADTLLPALIVR